MSSHLVDGIALPDAVAGHPALDFCNTRAGWGLRRPKEYLVGWPALVLWTREAALLPPDDAQALLRPSGPAVEPSRQAEEPSRQLARAVRLRDALYAAALGTGSARDWATLTREAVAARGRAALGPGEPGGVAQWRPVTVDVRTPVDLVALAAEQLLTSAAGTTVAACPGEGCGWLFTDPRRRRRWCSMAVCGNRAKARRFAAGRTVAGRSTSPAR